MGPVSGFASAAEKRGTWGWATGGPAPGRGARATVHHLCAAVAVAVAPGQQSRARGNGMAQKAGCTERGRRKWRSAYDWCPVVRTRGPGWPPMMVSTFP